MGNPADPLAAAMAEAEGVLATWRPYSGRVASTVELALGSAFRALRILLAASRAAAARIREAEGERDRMREALRAAVRVIATKGRKLNEDEARAYRDGMLALAPAPDEEKENG